MQGSVVVHFTFSKPAAERAPGEADEALKSVLSKVVGPARAGHADAVRGVIILASSADDATPDAEIVSSWTNGAAAAAALARMQQNEGQANLDAAIDLTFDASLRRVTESEVFFPHLRNIWG